MLDPVPYCVVWLKLVPDPLEEQTPWGHTGRQQRWAQRPAPRHNKAGPCSCSLEAGRPADRCDAVAGPGAEAGPEEAEAGPGSGLGSGLGEAVALPGLWVVLERWSRSCQTS